MTNWVSRKLHVRIWLAVAGSVAVLSLLVGWAWQLAEEQRERDRPPPTPREVIVRNGAGETIGSGLSVPRRAPGQGWELAVRMRDGSDIFVLMPPRGGPGGGPPPGRRREPGPMDWLRPPYGFLWMLGLAGLVVMIGIYPVARRLTQRLEGLQRGVQRWGEGDLAARLPETGDDEVADLSRRFNAAAQRIEALMDAQQALLKSQKSLLANASHELRSPLARIRMAMELGGQGGSAAARAEISRNISELDQLVDEILLASRLDAREADLGTVEPADLIGLLAEECTRVGVAMDLGAGASAVWVSGVSRLLRRAVRNLLENALRHGGTPDQVRAELMLAEGAALLRVEDRGPGVPAAQRERIFEPFYRLPGASERDGGVGLGLSLVRSIARRHGGDATCEAREGGGARFVLHLPALAEPPRG